MSKLPLKARIYLISVVLAGIAAAFFSRFMVAEQRPPAPWVLAGFALAAVLFGGRKISLNKLRKNDDAMSLTLGFAITFASLVSLGVAAVVPISVLCCLSSCLYPKVQKWPQLCFNVALSAVEATVAGSVYFLVTGGDAFPEALRTLAAIVLSASCFFFMNTLGVAIMVSLCTGERLYTTWKENFAWTAPSYFAAATLGALAVLLGHDRVWVLALFLLPVSVFIFQHFITHLAHVASLRNIKVLHAEQTQLAELFLRTTEHLALAIDAKDEYSHQHIVRVQRYSIAVAEVLELEEAERQGIQIGALLHDIGKLGVPDHIIRKRGKLTEEELEKSRMHVEIGVDILRGLDFPWPVLAIVRHHHERWDGSGYPDGLQGEPFPDPRESSPSPTFTTPSPRPARSGLR